MPDNVPAQRIWQAALGRLELVVAKPTFDTWLRETAGFAMNEGALTIEVPTTFGAAWLEQRMHGLIVDAVSAVARKPFAIHYRVRGVAPDLSDANDGTTVANPPTVQPSASAQGNRTPLNPAYTFDNFVVGSSNQLAYAAARAVTEAPGTSYNPLFLYGGVGLGKTHLLHAIGHQTSAAGLRVAYVTTEQFTNEYLTAIRERRTEEFRDRYRSLDVLLLDDIQFISGKESTQEGFFHTFNALRDAGRQVVITCDRLPNALPSLEERLRSRLEWGLMADINTPDYETRLAILQTRAARSRVAVPADVLEFLAKRMGSNIRALEGCLNRVTALAEFTGNSVTMEFALSAIGAITSKEKATITPKAVINTVASYYTIPASSIVGGRRDKPTAHARQVAMFLLKESIGLSPEEIGRTLGNRDRTTVIYGLKQIDQRSRTDSTFCSVIQELKSSLAANSENADPGMPS